jgi:hypothetical protein
MSYLVGKKRACGTTITVSHSYVIDILLNVLTT